MENNELDEIKGLPIVVNGKAVWELGEIEKEERNAKIDSEVMDYLKEKYPDIKYPAG